MRSLFATLVVLNLFSHFLREPYPANMQCDYTVQVARGSTVQLVLTDISLETSTDCNYDYVSVI